MTAGRRTVLLVLLTTSTVARAELELEGAAAVGTPELLGLCGAVSPVRALEIDACLGGFLSSHLALTSHAFLRHHLLPADSVVELSVGGGLGVRAMRTCSTFACGYSAGPEGLLSAELTRWMSPGFGLSAQTDGGLSLQFVEAAPGVMRHAWRFPLRLLLGVSFRR